MPTPTDIVTDSLTLLSDREKLMLIDMIADQLGDDYCDMIDLSAAFEYAEEGTSGVHTPHYPAGVTSPAVWSEWRKERDRVLNYWFALPAQRAA
jgi:hypothetical protein